MSAIFMAFGLFFILFVGLFVFAWSAEKVIKRVLPLWVGLIISLILGYVLGMLFNARLFSIHGNIEVIYEFSIVKVVCMFLICISFLAVVLKEY